VALPDRCIDVTPAQVAKALESSTSMGALLRHMAKNARPGEGAPKILVPIARMASNECDWFDEGGLTAEIVPADGKTVILIAMDLGLGMRELLFPRLHLGVPYEEFTRVLENAPQLVFPMKCRRTKKSILLTCAEEVMGTLAPPSFAASEADVRSVLPAKLRNSLAPIVGDVPKDAPSTKIEVDTGPVGEVAILARLAPKALRARKISEVDSLDMGWDVGAYSSGINTRATKPPPANAKVASKAPTKPPPSSRAGKSAPAVAPTGKGPPRPAIRRTSKRPARPKS
jgi:hypothetical protein